MLSADGKAADAVRRRHADEQREAGVRRRDDEAVLERVPAGAVQHGRVVPEVDVLRPEHRRIMEHLALRLERRHQDPDHRQQEERERHDHDEPGQDTLHPSPFRIRRTRIVATIVITISWM